MSIISGVTVDWSLSPRIMTIPIPIIKVNIEDLQDTLLDIEDGVEGMAFPHLRDTSGGQDLGGGVSVGWTMQLNNAQLAFEARTTPVSIGTATSDNSGVILTDSAATFITEGVKEGATIINFIDGSISSVTKVLSETQVKHLHLVGGTNNDWTIGDTYRIYNEIQCGVAGGNLTAVDSVGTSISPILATAFVQILKTSSSSATLQELSAIQYSSFNGGVTIDVDNGTTGIEYPIGTAESPVNNLLDAQTICVAKGFTKLYIMGNLTIGATDVISGYTLVGEGTTFNVAKTVVTLTNGCTTSNTFYEHLKIQGRQNGESIYENCIIGELTNTHCQFKNCGMLGPVTMVNSEWTQNHTTDLIGCHSSFDWYVVDYNHSPINQVYSNYSGKLKIINCTDSRADIMIQMDAGMIWIDASCTAGTISARGMGTLINDSALEIDIKGFIDGSLLQDLHDETFGKWVLNPTAKTMTLYKADGIAVLKTFALTDTEEQVPAFIARTPV